MPDSNSKTRNFFLNLGIALPFLLAGLWIVYFPTLSSGFHRMQSDAGDTRFFAFILEHSYLWLKGDPAHSQLWNAGVFYPAKGFLAYSDNLLGSMPFYWLIRALGISSPFTAFQVWQLLISSLSFLAMYFLIRVCLKFPRLASAVGAFCYAFTLARGSFVTHQQLWCQFYAIFFLYGLIRFWETLRARWLLWMAINLIIEVYAGMYFGWLFSLWITLWALSVVIGQKNYRAFFRQCFVYFRQNWLGILGTAIASGVLCWPMFQKYRYLVGSSKLFTDILGTAVPPLGWFHPFIDSFVYSWLWRFQEQPWIRPSRIEWVPELFPGFLTLGLAIFGFKSWFSSTAATAPLRKFFKHIIIASIALMVLGTAFFGQRFCLWWLVFHLYPGAKGIRNISRIFLVLTIPLGIGVSMGVTSLQKRTKLLVPIAIAAILVIEQFAVGTSFDKDEDWARIERLASKIDRVACKSFLYIPPLRKWDPSVAWDTNAVLNVDAMWVYNVTGVPTLNGYSSYCPPGWGFNAIGMPGFEEITQENAKSWIKMNDLDPKGVCRISG